MDASHRQQRAALLLSRSTVERLLTPDECIDAVETAFRQHALGTVASPGVLGMHVPGGGFHVKAASLTLDRPYFAAKLNANFPQNSARANLPTIQGVVALCDAENGTPLAVMDSMALTALRTAAATAVAAKYLAREGSRTLLICGCGAQAAAQLRALLRVRPFARVLVYDLDAKKAQDFAAAAREEALEASPVQDLAPAVAASDVVITCTTAQRYFIERKMVKPGTFVAGVGADNEHKQELDPLLLAASIVVADSLDQAATIGDLHHAIDAKIMSRDDVHAELGQVIAGLRRGRSSDDQTIVFDSTGTALQDVAAAAVVYRRAVEDADAVRFAFHA
ncbi:MAG TPA: ornithine cyclodeaminase family protein [Burkholderiales bacterium]|nr:ornithine cyclodeaminase family protein [Burkholderiales bacterium]